MTNAVIEYAGTVHPAVASVGRLKTRNAPPWVLRHGGKAARTATNPRTAAPAASLVLVGIVAPHVSEPVAVAGEPQPIREQITRDAWRAMLAHVERGRCVELLDRHGGVPMATTLHGSLMLSLDGRLGLTFQARLDRERDVVRRIFDWYGRFGAGVSIGFTALKAERRTILGREVRVVTDAVLDHIALVRKIERPAYPGANALFAGSDDAASVRAAFDEATRRAFLRLGGALA